MLILYIFSFRFVMFIFTRVIIQKAEQKLHQQGSLRICQYIYTIERFKCTIGAREL
jgi:hypothetical protein